MHPAVPPGGHTIRRLTVTVFAVVTLLTATTAQAKLRPDVIRYWATTLHNCEQPGGWHGGQPTYPGGLGVWYGNWPRWAGALRPGGRSVLSRFPTAADAPVDVQVWVADWAYRNERPRPYWDCFSHAGVGYPPG